MSSKPNISAFFGPKVGSTTGFFIFAILPAARRISDETQL